MPTAERMEPEDVLDLLHHLDNKRHENKMFLRWIMGPQFEVSFVDFKKEFEPKRMRSDEEIMAEVYKLFEGVSYGTGDL